MAPLGRCTSARAGTMLMAVAPLLALALNLAAHPARGQAFKVGGMAINLTEAQTIGSLAVAGPFDFAPPAGNGGFSHRLGDVTMRVRTAGSSGPLVTLTTARSRAVTPIVPLPKGELAAAKINLTQTSPGPAGTPTLELERHYAAAGGEADGVSMWFTLTNTGGSAVEVGGWGAALVFADMSVNYGVKRTLDTLAANCAFVDPAISGNHGFVSVTRMTGTGAVLLMVPDKQTDFQAYRFLNSEASGGKFYELTSLSKAYAEQEWVNSTANQWLEPGSLTLKPGQAHTFAYRLLLADSVRGKDAALAHAGFAVLQAVPSYTIATDMQSALLHVLPPRGAAIKSTAVEPSTALSLGTPTAVGGKGIFALAVRGKAMGRARVTLTYTDGSQHVASYFVLPPLDEHVTKYGSFMANTAWYGNESDPFGRGLSVLAWNRELKKHIGVGAWDNGYEDNRIFNNGLSDEAGAGANVGFAAAVGGTVIPEQAAKLDLYITKTVYGVKKGLPFGASLQCVKGAPENPSCGPANVTGPTEDGVMASMFWVPTSTAEPKMPGYDYDPRWFCDRDTPKDCTTGWPGWRWDQQRGASLGRAYNYAHVSSTYLGMYQAAQYDKLSTVQPRLWYLTRAYKTIVAMFYQASWYSHQGLMDGTNFWTILEALKDEGMATEAAHVEDIMRDRTVVGVTNKCRYYVINNKIYDLGNDKPGCHWYQAENVTSPWVTQTGLPGAGSEFAWDTTGQEEAYVWGKYFNATALADSALNQILAYTPLVPNWAYHGSAYGFGDFSNNGYIRFNGGGERVLQHYRSGLNSIPSTEAFLRDPADLYLLRLAAGSISGVLANIDSDGAPSMAFHSDQSLLVFDPASGDHGLAYYGHSHNTQSFVVAHPDLGWLCYFCDLAGATELAVHAAPAKAASTVTVTPRDSYRKKVYVAALGLQIVSDAGTLAGVTLTVSGSSVTAVTISFNPPGKQPLSRFRLRLLTRSGSKAFRASGLTPSRGGYDVTPSSQTAPTTVTVTWA